MVETFGEIKEAIDDAMNNFRRSNLTLIRSGKDNALKDAWRPIQISVNGTDIWRRVLVPENRPLEDLHQIIQICMEWKDDYRHHFYTEAPGGMDKSNLDDKMKMGEVCALGVSELHYEYGTRWNIKIVFLFLYQPGKEELIRCVAGEGAAPPEAVSGPVRFRKILSHLEGGSDAEKQAALYEIGPHFVPGLFSMEKYNRDFFRWVHEKK
jgi:hypothetical protein